MFAAGDKVELAEEVSVMTHLRGYANILKGKVGLVYCYHDLSDRYLYVFFPELPGSGFSDGYRDPMISLCYGLYEVDLEPSP